MELIAIGRISKPIGTRGEMKILPLTDTVQRFVGLSAVWVGCDENKVDLFDISAVRVDTKQAILSLQGVESAEEAEKFRNKFLFVPKEKVVMLQAGSYFMDDVLGCEVATDEQIYVGKIADILSLPANDLWVVRNGTKEILIPAVKAIVRKVDVKTKCITIHALEGLLD